MAKRTLEVQLVGDPKSLVRALGKGGSAAQTFEQRVGRASQGVGRGLLTVGKVATAAIGIGLVGALKESVDAFAESERVSAQTTAVLRSTGKQANVTKKQVEDLATAVSRKTGIDDEAVQAQENLLLTFTKVRNEAGKNNDIFTQATQTVTDLATSMNHGAVPTMEQMHSSSIKIGKALNDPVKGLTALTKVGVTFTEGQKKQVTALVESGNRLGAQKLILRELKTEFGGAAEAAGNTFSGKIAKAKVAVGNLYEAIGGQLIPVLGSAAQGTADFVNSFVTSDRPARFFAGVKDAADSAKGAVSGLVDSFRDRRSGGASVATAIAGTLTDAIGSVDWGKVGDKIADGFSKGANIAGKIAPAVKEGTTAGLSAAFSNVDAETVLQGLVTGLTEAIKTLLSPQFWIDNIETILSTVVVVIPLGKILKIPGMGWLYNKISKPFLDVLTKAIRAAGSGALAAFKAVAGAGISGFANGLLAGGGRVAGTALRLLLKVTSRLEQLPGRLLGIGRDAAGGLGQGILSRVRQIGANAGSLVSRVLDAVGGLASKMVGVGKDLVGGLISGIASKAGALVSTIKNFITDKIPGFVKKAFKSTSPSRVMHDIGADLGQGLANGIRSRAGTVRAAATAGFLFPLDAAVTALNAKKEKFQASMDAWDAKRGRGDLLAAIQTARKGTLESVDTDSGGTSTGGSRGGSGLSWARSMVGHFKESTGQNTGPELDKLQKDFGMRAAAWCAMFATTALVKAGAPKELKSASVAQLRGWAQAGTHGFERGVKSKGRAGDLMAWGNNHIAVVEKIVKGVVHTIEGNTSSGKVARRTRSMSSGDFFRVAGMGAGGSSGGSRGSSLLTSGQKKYGALLATKTGLDPSFIAAWLLSEESGGAAKKFQKAGSNNWLNIGPGRKYKSVGAGASAAAKLLGTSRYADIMSANGPAAQIAALVASPWDAGHYRGGGGLRSLLGKFKVNPFGSAGKGSAVRKVDQGAVSDAVRALKDFDRQAARSKKLAAIDVQIRGLEQFKAWKSALTDIKARMQDAAKTAADAWRQTQEAAIEAARASRQAAIEASRVAQHAAVDADPAYAAISAIDAQDKAEDRARTMKGIEKDIADATWLVAHSGGKARTEALEQLETAKAAKDRFLRDERRDELQAAMEAAHTRVDAETDIALRGLEGETAAAIAALDYQTAAYQAGLDAQLGILTGNLEARKSTYAQWAADVNRILGTAGLSAGATSDEEVLITAGPGASTAPANRPYNGYGAFQRPRGRAVGGRVEPGRVYRINELGPENVVFDRSGTVTPASQSRGGGGLTVNYNGTVNFGSRKSVQIEHNRLAHRLSFG